MRRRNHARTRSSSRSLGSRSTVSGSTRSPKWSPATLSPDLRIVRKSVVEAVGVLDDVHGQLRERLELEARLEPEEHVALDPEMRRELREQTRQPRPCGDHQTARPVTALRREHAHALTVALPAFDRLGEAERRAVPFRDPEMRFDRALRGEPAGLRIEEAGPVAIDVEERIPSLELGVVEYLVREVVHPRARERSRHQLDARRSHVQTAGLREEV